MKTTANVIILLLISNLAFSQVSVSTVTEEIPASGGVKIGPDGNVYIANFGDALSNPNGTQVWKYYIEPDSLLEFATGLFGASGNDFDSQGNLFQSNIAGGLVSKITPDGTVTTFVTNGIQGPVGIAIDDQDNLYVCNCSLNNIRKVTPEGVSTVFSSGSIFICPNGITIADDGNFYVSNFNNGNVIKIDQDGNASVFKTIPGGNNGHLTFSSPDSNLYVASHGSSKIYRLSLSGDLEVLAGSGLRGNQDGNAENATFSRPNGIAATLTGDTLFVNSSIPTTNVGLPLNPSVLRMITGVNDQTVGVPDQFNETIRTFTVYPNPLRSTMNVAFELRESSRVSLALYGMDGKFIKELYRNSNKTGKFDFKFSISLDAGIYMLVLNSNHQSLSRIITIY